MLKDISIKPICPLVEDAKIAFKSLANRPLIELEKIVIMAINVITVKKITFICINKWEILNNKYTPITTIVAEWRNAETGVGPSMASKIQIFITTCTDFIVIDIIIKKKIISIIFRFTI